MTHAPHTPHTPSNAPPHAPARTKKDAIKPQDSQPTQKRDGATHEHSKTPKHIAENVIHPHTHRTPPPHRHPSLHHNLVLFFSVLSFLHPNLICPARCFARCEKEPTCALQVSCNELRLVLLKLTDYLIVRFRWQLCLCVTVLGEVALCVLKLKLIRKLPTHSCSLPYGTTLYHKNQCLPLASHDANYFYQHY